jgi:hypothetical protein
MVFDKRRNQAYFRALEKLVTPDTKVMDLDAGLVGGSEKGMPGLLTGWDLVLWERNQRIVRGLI